MLRGICTRWYVGTRCIARTRVFGVNLDVRSKGGWQGMWSMETKRFYSLYIVEIMEN